MRQEVFAKLEAKTNARGATFLTRDETALLSVDEGSSAFVGVSTTVISGMDNVTYKRNVGQAIWGRSVHRGLALRSHIAVENVAQ